jgi:hypothetical protein
MSCKLTSLSRSVEVLYLEVVPLEIGAITLIYFLSLSDLVEAYMADSSKLIL